MTTFQTLLRAASNLTGASVSEIVGAGRSAYMVKARAAIVLLSRGSLGWTFRDIGRQLGDRDHSSIIHLYTRAVARFSEPEFSRLVHDMANAVPGVDLPIVAPNYEPKRKGAKVTPGIALAIRNAYQLPAPEGYRKPTMGMIGERFGVSAATVCKVVQSGGMVV
jgi:hypothetical protein